jgi:hypothetical protein
MNYEKLNKVLAHYLDLLEVRKKRAKKSRHPGNFRKGIRTRQRIIDFFIKNGEWPSVRSTYMMDKKLGNALENYVCPKSVSYDPVLRRIVMATGRKTNNKRSHNPAMFKEQILEFIKLTGHAPRRYSDQKLPGEGNLKAKLDYYTLTNNDMYFLGKVYGLDKCHRSGIPMKFRPLLNRELEVGKPLVNLTQTELKNDA